MKIDVNRAHVAGGSSGIRFAITPAILADGAKVAITRRRTNVVSSTAEELRRVGGAVIGISRMSVRRMGADEPCEVSGNRL